MESSTITSKGQLVIPSKLRKKYKIKEGTKINFIEESDGIKLLPITAELIRENIGFLGTKGKLIKALMDEKKKEKEL
jgi:AbrB family looped-hinge helix DNA binding protein